MRPLRREIVFLDSQYAEHESGFGDEEYRAIFRSIYEFRHAVSASNFGYVPLAISSFCSTIQLALFKV